MNIRKGLLTLTLTATVLAALSFNFTTARAERRLVNATLPVSIAEGQTGSAAFDEISYGGD